MKSYKLKSTQKFLVLSKDNLVIHNDDRKAVSQGFNDFSYFDGILFGGIGEYRL